MAITIPSLLREGTNIAATYGVDVAVAWLYSLDRDQQAAFRAAADQVIAEAGELDPEFKAWHEAALALIREDE